jgi:hypothetical protein
MTAACAGQGAAKATRNSTRPLSRLAMGLQAATSSRSKIDANAVEFPTTRFGCRPLPVGPPPPTGHRPAGAAAGPKTSQASGRSMRGRYAVCPSGLGGRGQGAGSSKCSARGPATATGPAASGQTPLQPRPVSVGYVVVGLARLAPAARRRFLFAHTWCLNALSAARPKAESEICWGLGPGARARARACGAAAGFRKAQRQGQGTGGRGRGALRRCNMQHATPLVSELGPLELHSAKKPRPCVR